MDFNPNFFENDEHFNLAPDDQADIATVAAVMSDATPLPVIINITQAWLLISGLQLACRHPGVSNYTKTQWELIGRQFHDSITMLHPEADSLLERGWDADYDV